MAEEYSLVVRPPREEGAANLIELRPSFMTRVTNAARYLVSGKPGQVPNWFGPEAPLPPQAPPQIAGREFDFPTGYNLQYEPKFLEGPRYGTLRNLSYAYDLLRLVIETRKDEVCKMGWSISYKDEKKKTDDRCAKIEDFFALPDKDHTWEEWLRLLLEDLLVIDAPCLYPRFAMDGSLFALEPVDGSTIKRVIDDWGRTPQVPTTAYQQILKGLPATDYDRDSLIYRPRNLRTNRVYGFSPVEQILITINIALNRQASQLSYYTEGSTPDLILSVPESWTPEQVRQFKVGWDAALKGNTKNRRGTMFVYAGTNVIDTKEKALTSETDEWLARVICYCFGQSSQPFVKQVNRATAETAKETAKEQGVAATMAWVANLMNLILAHPKYFNAPDLRFRWVEEEEVDAKTKAEIFALKVSKGATTINEWRESDGQEPIEGGDVALIYTASGATPLERVLEPPEPPPPMPGAFPGSAPAAPGKKPLDRDSTDGKPTPPKKPLEKALRPVTSDEISLQRKIAKALRKVRADVLVSIGGMDVVEKAHGTKTKSLIEPDTVLSNLNLSAFEEVTAAVEAAVMEVGEEEFVKSLTQVGAEDSLFDLANPRAVAYAEERALELVTELEDSTRKMLRSTIVKALDEGRSYAQLAKDLEEEYAFSAERAEAIASTEMNDAVTNSQLEAWKASGVVIGKSWLLSEDEGVCSICEANAAQGTIPLEDAFQSGDEGPTAHPRCRCSLSPRVE